MKELVAGFICCDLISDTTGSTDTLNFSWSWGRLIGATIVMAIGGASGILLI